MGAEELQSAWELLKEAYQYQLGGDYEMAVELYRRSLDLHPTAEAYTFLGWTYRFQGKLDAAITECKKAIQIDPEFGNPYNDIGAYLIEKGEYDEAESWLLRASSRVDTSPTITRTTTWGGSTWRRSSTPKPATTSSKPSSSALTMRWRAKLWKS